MEEKEDFYIQFDPSEDKVLGAINDEVHVQVRNLDSEDWNSFLVLKIPFEEYKRVWQNWLKGKQDYCERYNHYCGVMGCTFAKEFYKEDSNITINIWNPAHENYESVECDTYFVSKFEDHNVYMKIQGWYQSHHGTDFHGDLRACSKEVTPKEQKITVYQ